jgi:DNA-binding transcriptional regulator YiaG
MAANVEVLIPNDRTRVALKSIRKARFATSPSSSASGRILVARLADLDRAQGRRELENLFDTVMVEDDIEVVLISTKTDPPRSEAAFQALAHLTWRAGREIYIAPNADAVARMVFARQAKAEKDLIASATIEGDTLIVWSCEPRRYAVSVSEISALAKMTPETLSDFELSRTGSRIHWNNGDIDLGLDGIRVLADPDVRRRREAEYRKQASRYAGAIRKLREQRGIKQTEIPGLSERQVRRLEQGKTLPHGETLKKLAATHGMAIEDYMRALARLTRSDGKDTKIRPVKNASKRVQLG